MAQPERDVVERPLLAHLTAGLGWTQSLDGLPEGGVPGNPAASGRGDFQAEVLTDRLRAAVHRFNPGPDGTPWLDEQRLDRIIATLVPETQRVHAQRGLVEANRAVTDLLLDGVPVPGLPDWDGGRDQKIQLIVWDDWRANDLCVIRQFRLDRATDGGAPFVVLDVVLFVNGIPLAVVKCKHPDQPSPIAAAIADLRAYAGQRKSGEREGVPAFFRFVQVTVATDGERAKLGTITSLPEHYAEWTTSAPATDEQVRDELLAALPNRNPDQRLTRADVLVAGVLRPAHLLDLVRNFSVFIQFDDRQIKIVARYQQFRAVHAIVRRLLKPGTPDEERGGILWHTQGSGKSLTMVFLVRKMRATPGLDTFKIVVVSDRVDLQAQLSPVLALTGEQVYVARRAADAREFLVSTTPDLTQLMIQQAQRDDTVLGADEAPVVERLVDDSDDTELSFPELNTSPRILLLIDEAHRNQTGWLHARLSRAVPNAAKIGLTGTPITRGRKTDTYRIFGQPIDTYTLRESESDGATVPIRYEGRPFEPRVIDRVELDATYEAEISGTTHDRERVTRCIRLRDVLSAEGVIADKARDMLHHWVDAVLPNGFKAQVVAASRLAAVRYRDALLAARDELVRDLEEYRDGVLPADQEAESFLQRALPYLALLRVIDFVPVISAGQRKGQKRDPTEWRAWTDKVRQDRFIKLYQRRLPAPEIFYDAVPHPFTVDVGGNEPWRHTPPGPPLEQPVHQPSRHDPWDQIEPDDAFRHPRGAGDSGIRIAAEDPEPVAFVIVVSMLLTGFDAPIEQALYVDRPLREAELLQAIARTNRTSRWKTHGLVVDYVSLSENLQQALSDYDVADIEGADLRLVEHEMPILRARRSRIVSFLHEHGIAVTDLSALAEPSIQNDLLVALANPAVRAELDREVRPFLATVDVLLPRPEALMFEGDVRALGAVQYKAYHIYRDGRSEGVDPYLYGAKVRRLLDEHLRASDPMRAVPPTSITSPEFAEHLAEETDTRIRALEMEHALRRHIDGRLPSDPVRYQRLSDRLEDILARLHGSWDQLAFELDGLRDDVTAFEVHSDHLPSGEEIDLDRRTGRPIFGLLEEWLAQLTPSPRSTSTLSRHDLVRLTGVIVEVVREGVAPPHFPESPHLQETLRKSIRRTLIDAGAFDRPKATEVSTQILDIVRANRRHYLEGPG